MRSISLSLPVYHQIKNKTFLVGLNWFRNSHYQELNKVKKYYNQLIVYSLNPCKHTFDKYTINYTYFYKNSRSDALNVISVIDKFLQDALQDAGVIENDNVKFYMGGCIMPSVKDKENPRLEVKIIKYTNEVDCDLCEHQDIIIENEEVEDD